LNLGLGNNTLINQRYLVSVLHFAVTLSVLIGASQVMSAELTSLIKQTGFRAFSTEQGLTQNTINRFYQDNNGFIWIATEAGLNRLDGSQIQHFVGPDGILTGDAISQVKEDSDGGMWVATFDHLYRLDKSHQHIETIPLPQMLDNVSETNFVIDVLEERPGHFWVVTRHGLLYLQLANKDIQIHNAMQTLWQDKARIIKATQDVKRIYLATTEGLYSFHKQSLQITKETLTPTFDADIITELLLLDENRLLVGSLNGALIYSLDAATNKTQSLINRRVLAAEKMGDNVFFASYDQLFLFHLGTERLLHVFSLSEILPRYSDYRIIDLFVDRRGKLWIGTESQGAYLWDPNSLKFETLSTLTKRNNPALSDNSVWSFAEGKNGGLWVGTDNGLNFVHPESEAIQTFFTQDTPDVSVDRARMLDMLRVDDNLWLATADGLIRFDLNTYRSKVFRPANLSKNEIFFIYSLTHTPEGILWLASDTGPVSFNPKTETFSYKRDIYTNNEPEEATLIRYFDGLLWIGYADRLDTYDYKRKYKNTVFKFGHLKKTFDLSLTDFHVENNHLWVSFSAAGIYVIDRSTSEYRIIKHFDQKTGFVDNVIHTLESEGDFIWASSHSGLVKIHKENFSYQVFDYYNGLPTNEFNEGAALKTRNGKLLFGAANGLLMISPQELTLPDEEIRPTITSLLTNDQQLFSNGFSWEERNIVINEKESFIQLNLSVLDYLSPHKWHYEYWLDGDQKSASQIVENNKITLTNIQPGNYQLKIRAIMPNTKVYQQVTHLPFTVTPHVSSFYHVKIFAALVVAILLIYYLFYRNRLYKQLVAQNRQLIQKKQRLEFALLGKQQGVWDWKNLSGRLADSTITVFLQQSDNLVLTLSQYRSYIHQGDIHLNRREWLNFLHGRVDEISLTYRIYLFEKWIWCRVNGKITQRLPSGKPIRATGTWLDISEERNITEKLEMFEKAIQSTRDIIFIIDHELNIQMVNKAYENHTGFESEGLIGMNLIEIARKRFDQESIEELTSNIQEKRSWQGEATMPTKNAPSFPVDVRIDAFDPTEPDTQYIMVMTDTSSLTDRMESQISSSYFDSITGLPNRVLAHDRLSHAIAHAKLHDANVVLIYLDLDKFDFYQQTLGKSCAREIIVNASKQIAGVLNKDDTFARVERDKFYIIFENPGKLENITFKIEEILNHLSQPQEVGSSIVELTACVGVACYPHDASTTNNLMTCASEALSQAKALGRNKVSFFHKDMNKRASDRLAMKTSLQHAINNNQFFLVFQPKFDLDSERINGFEVFVRWRTAEGNIIYPSQFIKIAEETGLIESLTDWLINQAFRTLRQWKQDGINTVFSVNLIPKYCQRVGSPNYLMRKLKEYDLTPMNIQIEINEKHFTEEVSGNIDFINLLTQKGFNVTLDDFGVGNTPLSYLKNLKIDSIKLERNFVRGIGKDQANDALVKSIINMANVLGYTPAAKSIEYQEQLTFLLAAGCKVGQGYYFSDPLSENSARQFMLSSEEKA